MPACTPSTRQRGTFGSASSHGSPSDPGSRWSMSIMPLRRRSRRCGRAGTSASPSCAATRSRARSLPCRRSRRRCQPLPAARDALYWTDFAIAADRPFRQLAYTFGGRIGWTVEHSQSGFNAVRHHLLRHRAGRKARLFRQAVGPLVTPRRVTESLLSGEIDVGPLDSYYHELLRRFELQTASRLRTVESTAPTPMPLLVASATAEVRSVDRLRRTLVDCAMDAGMAGVLAELPLTG